MLAGEIFDPTTRHTYTAPNGQNYVVENPFANNTIPFSQLDPVALKIQALIPAAGNGNPINNLIPAYDAVRHTTIPALKIDQLIGTKQKVSFYWSKTTTYAPFSPIYGGSEGLPSPITADRGSFIGGPVERLNYDYTLSPTCFSMSVSAISRTTSSTMLRLELQCRDIARVDRRYADSQLPGVPGIVLAATGARHLPAAP